MDVKRFLQKITDKFPRDMCETDVEDLTKFFKKVGATEENLDDLYDRLLETYEYKTFPSFKFIRDTWNTVTGADKVGYTDPVMDIIRHNNSIERDWKKWAWEKVIKRLEIIEKKILSRSDDLTDISFWYIFSHVLYELRYMRERAFDSAAIQRQMEYIMERIREGKSWIPLSGEVPERDVKRKERVVSIGDVL